MLNSYTKIDKNLKLELIKVLDKFDFYESKTLLRGLCFEHKNKIQAIIIDYEICNSLYPFSYTEYTKEQNNLMNEYKSVYRFMIDKFDDIKVLEDELSIYLNGDFQEDKIKVSGTNRQLVEIDPTIPEAYFEQAFIDV